MPSMMKGVSSAPVLPVRRRSRRGRWGEWKAQLQVVDGGVSAVQVPDVGRIEAYTRRGRHAAGCVTIVAHQDPKTAALQHVTVRVGARAGVVDPRPCWLQPRGDGGSEVVHHPPAESGSHYGRVAIWTLPLVQLPHGHAAAVRSGGPVEQDGAAHARRRRGPVQRAPGCVVQTAPPRRRSVLRCPTGPVAQRADLFFAVPDMGNLALSAVRACRQHHARGS
eukprot:scaffold124740_cov63-Phaeocystis_antarctica.AAC.3